MPSRGSGRGGQPAVATTAPASSDEDWSSSDDDELYVEVEDYSMYMKEVDFLSNTRNVRRRIGGDV